MKRMLNCIILLTVIVMALTAVLSACDLVRKMNGAEVKFQKKVKEAADLSFDLGLEIVTDGEKSAIDVSCFKKGNEYAYTFMEPGNTSVIYRRLYAHNKLYEFVTKTNLHVGMYYTTNDVDYKDDNNLLYWVTENIMLATYATLLTTGEDDKVNGVDTHRYDFDYGGNQYSLWYDAESLVKISATFNSTDEDGTKHSETYTGVFSNYKFADVDASPFWDPAETKNNASGIIYTESPIPFEDWMNIINKFSARVANWM